MTASRSEFEAYLRSDEFNKLVCSDKWEDPHLVATAIWQAARASVVVELPAEKPIPHNLNDESRHRRSGYNLALHEVKAAIHQAGCVVKV